MKDSTATEKLRLSTSGLSNIRMQNDFDFIVGGSHHRCPSFVADFLSPKIARLHNADPTIDNFVISASDRHGDFDSFVSLGRGDGICLGTLIGISFFP
jgi:hypothetical protein